MPDEDEAVPDQEMVDAKDAADKDEAPHSAASPVPEEAVQMETAPTEAAGATQLPATALELPGASPETQEVSVDVVAASSEEDASIDVDASSDSEEAQAPVALTHAPQRRAPEVDRDPDARPSHKSVAIDVDGLDDSFDDDEDEDEEEESDSGENIEQQTQATATIDLTESIEGTPPRRRHAPPQLDEAEGTDDEDDEDEDNDRTPVEDDITADDALGSEAEPLDERDSEAGNGESEAEPTAEEDDQAGEEGDTDAIVAVDVESKDDAGDAAITVEHAEEEAHPQASSSLETQVVTDGMSEMPSATEATPVDGTDEAEDEIEEDKPGIPPTVPESDIAQEQRTTPREGIQEEEGLGQISKGESASKAPPEVIPAPAAAEAVVDIDDGEEMLDDDDDGMDVGEVESEMIMDDGEGLPSSDKERVALSQNVVPSEPNAGGENSAIAQDVLKATEKPGVSEGETSEDKSPPDAMDEDEGGDEADVADVPMTKGTEDSAVPHAATDTAAVKEDHGDSSGVPDAQVTIDKDEKMDDAAVDATAAKGDLGDTSDVPDGQVSIDKDAKMDDATEDPTSEVNEAPSAPSSAPDRPNHAHKLKTQTTTRLGSGPAVASQKKKETSSVELDKPHTDQLVSTDMSASKDVAVLASAQVDTQKPVSTTADEGGAMEREKKATEATDGVSRVTNVIEKNFAPSKASDQATLSVQGTDLESKPLAPREILEERSESNAAVTALAPALSTPKADTTKSPDNSKAATALVKAVPISPAGGEVSAKESSPPDAQTVQRLKPSPGPAAITTPMFGIEPPSRAGPVSFSSPPSFHRPRLSPSAAPFVPAALRAEKAPTPPAAPLDSDTNKVTPEQRQKGSSTLTGVTIDNAGLQASESAVADKSGAGPSAKVGASVSVSADKGTPVNAAAKKPTLKKDLSEPEQTLRRIPIKGTSGGMTYNVDNVAIIVRAGSSKKQNLRRFALCTVEAKIRPDGESTMKFFEGLNDSKSKSFAFLSSKKNRVRIKKVVNKPFVFSVTVLGPSGQEKGGDASKYYIHLQEHTFQVFYDACIMFILDVVMDKDRPTTVRFQEPQKKDNQSVGTKAPLPVKKPNNQSVGTKAPIPVKKPINKETRINAPKVASMDQRKLLLQKMEALKKKKAVRSTDSSPKRDTSHADTTGKATAAKPSTPAPLNAKRESGMAKRKDVSSVAKPTPSESSAPVVNPKTGILAASQSTVGSASLNLPPKLQLLTPKTRPVPSSPKKRPAFRMEERGEGSMKKARLTVPKKRMFVGASARASTQGGQAVDHTVSGNSSKIQAVSTPASVKMAVTNKQQPPGQQPSVLRKPVSVVLKHPPSGMNISFEEKEKLELDSKRLLDLLAGIKAAGSPAASRGMDSLSASLRRCEPRNASDFFDRLHTFRPSTWRGFASGHILSPVECARRGWYNSGIDQLTSTEGAEISAQFERCLDNASLAKEQEKLKALVLGQGHRLLSGWIGESCPIEFETLEGSSRVYSSTDLNKNADELRRTRAIDILEKGGTKWEAALEELSLEIKCASLAAFNWRARVSDERELDLQCNWCNRSILLAPECLIGMEGPGTIAFSPRRSHYSFCPFNRAEDAFKRNAAAMGVASSAPSGIQAPGTTDGDTKMSEA